MTADLTRDAAMTAAILGFFASSWFGWAQEKPPTAWRAPLTIGSVVSLLVAVAGAVLAWPYWTDGTVFTPAVGYRFGVVVGVEFALCGLGAGVLAALGKAELTSVWIALVVGVHFFLAPLLRYPLLYLTAMLVSFGSLAALVVAQSYSITISAIVGLVVGALLLASALYSLSTTLV